MFNFKIYYKADNGKSQSKSEKGAEKSALPLRISPFFAGEDGFKEPEKASMLLFSSVMIVFPLCIDERKGNQTRQCFRCNRCKPDAVHAEQCRQNQDACRLEEKRSGERNHGGDESVVQCGKEAGGGRYSALSAGRRTRRWRTHVGSARKALRHSRRRGRQR